MASLRQRIAAWIASERQSNGFYMPKFPSFTDSATVNAEMADVLRADDGDATTMAPMHELDADLRRLVEERFRVRGGGADVLPIRRG